ncbi:MAG: hypothetical protein KBA26_03590 [Candidatus Delongbacteria bacterium]|nr:hypothetical protein [Candidatus Delongbacteria bacterium]
MRNKINQLEAILTPADDADTSYQAYSIRLIRCYIPFFKGVFEADCNAFDLVDQRINQLENNQTLSHHHTADRRFFLRLLRFYTCIYQSGCTDSPNPADYFNVLTQISRLTPSDPELIRFKNDIAVHAMEGCACFIDYGVEHDSLELLKQIVDGLSVYENNLSRNNDVPHRYYRLVLQNLKNLMNAHSRIQFSCCGTITDLALLNAFKNLAEADFPGQNDFYDNYLRMKLMNDMIHHMLDVRELNNPLTFSSIAEIQNDSIRQEIKYLISVLNSINAMYRAPYPTAPDPGASGLNSAILQCFRSLCISMQANLTLNFPDAPISFNTKPFLFSQNRFLGLIYGFFRQGLASPVINTGMNPNEVQYLSPRQKDYYYAIRFLSSDNWTPNSLYHGLTTETDKWKRFYLCLELVFSKSIDKAKRKTILRSIDSRSVNFFQDDAMRNRAEMLICSAMSEEDDFDNYNEKNQKLNRLNTILSTLKDRHDSIQWRICKTKLLECMLSDPGCQNPDDSIPLRDALVCELVNLRNPYGYFKAQALGLPCAPPNDVICQTLSGCNSISPVPLCYITSNTARCNLNFGNQSCDTEYNLDIIGQLHIMRKYYLANFGRYLLTRHPLMPDMYLRKLPLIPPTDKITMTGELAQSPVNGRVIIMKMIDQVPLDTVSFTNSQFRLEGLAAGQWYIITVIPDGNYYPLSIPLYETRTGALKLSLMPKYTFTQKSSGNQGQIPFWADSDSKLIFNPARKANSFTLDINGKKQVISCNDMGLPLSLVRSGQKCFILDGFKPGLLAFDDKGNEPENRIVKMVNQKAIHGLCDMRGNSDYLALLDDSCNLHLYCNPADIPCEGGSYPLCVPSIKRIAFHVTPGRHVFSYMLTADGDLLWTFDFQKTCHRFAGYNQAEQSGMICPSNLITDDNGYVYVADPCAGKVFIFSPAGYLADQIDLSKDPGGYTLNLTNGNLDIITCEGRTVSYTISR